MGKSRTPDLEIPEGLKDKLLKVVETGVRLANRNIDYVRTLAVLGIAASLWLGYYTGQLLSLSLPATLAICTVLLLPALLLGKLFFALREVQELPARLDHFLAGFKSSLEEYHQKARARLRTSEPKRRLADLLSFGRDLREILRLARNTGGLAEAIGGAMVLGNPVFLVFVLVASGATALLILIAVVTLLVFIL